MQQFIEIGQTGEVAKDVINGNFSELYTAIPTPVKLPGETDNFQYVIPGNTKITLISMIAVTGTPTIRVGTTPNGDELVKDSIIQDDTDFDVAKYFADPSNIYITFTLGPGKINMRINTIANYY